MNVRELLDRLPRSVRVEVEHYVRRGDYDGLVRYIAKVLRISEKQVRRLIEK